MLPRLPLSASLLMAVAVQLACQAFKVVYYSVRERRFAPSWFVSAGGMPSAHSAFVTALTVSVGLGSGFGSDLFAVAFVFSVITIYDALRLRGAVEHHARILSRLVEKHPDIQAGPLNVRLGHSAPEIAAGIVAGGGLAVLAGWILGRL
ncbi:MAG: divergent PAP2 family protein [Spirochaetia bacterium]|jgi:acid phosphatase family membrane protein YuiD